MDTQFIIKFGALEKVGGSEKDLLELLGMKIDKAEYVGKKCPKCKRSSSEDNHLIEYYVYEDYKVGKTFEKRLKVYSMCICGNVYFHMEEVAESPFSFDDIRKYKLK